MSKLSPASPSQLSYLFLLPGSHFIKRELLLSPTEAEMYNSSLEKSNSAFRWLLKSDHIVTCNKAYFKSKKETHHD